jgi:serine/threonine protein phosphatase PrpC
MMVARAGKRLYCLPTKQTWLGAFSHLGVRQRIPALRATAFHTRELDPGDVVYVYSDGVDECVYEKATLSLAMLAQLSEDTSAPELFGNIMDVIAARGAEDNASLAIVRFPMDHWQHTSGC